ncbi:MAG: dihydrolipoyl dehydrogenase [Acidimicrobiales bacterium]
MVIIGGGPGGYVAGIRCGQLGVPAIVVDDQPLGGTCLNVGCIPSKALIHAADEFARIAEAANSSTVGISVGQPAIDLAATVGWKDGIVDQLNRGVGSLLAAVGTEVITGRATMVDGKTCDVALAGDGGRVLIQADDVVIATGSSSISLPALPFDGDRVISSTDALALDEVPSSIAVVGGGYIGLELGTAFAKLGTKVTVVEAEDRVLPAFDVELTRPVSKRLAELDIDVMTSTRALRVADDSSDEASGANGNGLVVAGEDGDELAVPADKILVTVGRKPNTAGLGLGGLGLTTDRGAIVVDERGHTSMRRVWAIGDVTGEPMLAHRAMKQGEIVAEAIAGGPSVFDARAIPAIVFTDPEVVVVGEAPDEAERNHGELVVGRFPLAANGRTMTLASPASGVVRVVARASDHLVVGIQAVGPAVAELSAAFGLAMEMGATLEDIAGTIHAHPTVGEAFHEAALTALGHPLHMTGPRR